MGARQEKSGLRVVDIKRWWHKSERRSSAIYKQSAPINKPVQ